MFSVARGTIGNRPLVDSPSPQLIRKSNTLRTNLE